MGRYEIRVCTRLKEIRGLAGVTAHDLEKATGLMEQVFTTVENGRGSRQQNRSAIIMLFVVCDTRSKELSKWNIDLLDFGQWDESPIRQAALIREISEKFHFDFNVITSMMNPLTTALVTDEDMKNLQMLSRIWRRKRGDGEREMDSEEFKKIVIDLIKLRNKLLTKYFELKTMSTLLLLNKLGEA